MSELPDFEKMDLFYLGRELDQVSGETSNLPLLYKNKGTCSGGDIKVP